MSKNVMTQRDKSIVLLYMSGVEIEKIANKASISTSTIYSVLRKHNIPVIRKNKEARKYFRKAILHAVVKERKSVYQIAEESEMNVDADVINAYVNYEFAQISKKKKKEQVKSEGKDLSNRAGGLGDRNFMVMNKPGSVMGETEEDLQKQAELERKLDEGEVSSADVLHDFISGGDGADGDEDIKMQLLRELLRYAATVTEIPDYSDDKLLDADYLLPLDIIIMKDITARTVSGESPRDIVKVRAMPIELVEDVIEGKLTREQFRNRYIKYLVSTKQIRPL